ncbi:hypothetical protein JVU11DRAFT_5677 [Chiua virens]|nr:hypothetical protein JVU11DRAFT_5677 [Chiua virens]
MAHSSYPRSALLILGQFSVYSILPSTLFAQVESLIQNAKLAEAEALLERTEADFAQGSTSPGGLTEHLRYLHQCLAFVFVRQTRFREATVHFIEGTIDPRVLLSYFDELRPALFNQHPSSEECGTAAVQGVEQGFVEVEVWDGVKEYMPDETRIDDIIATNLVRNYSPYLRPGAIPSPARDEPTDAGPSTFDPQLESGTRIHPATIAMREGMREEATEMVKSVLAAVLGSAEIWSRDVIEVTSTALALLYAHARDVPSLLALFAPPSSGPSAPSSRPVSRSGSQPPSRPSSSFRTLNLLGALLEMWKVFGDGEKVIEVLVGLTEGTHVDPSIVDPLDQIFTILAPTRPDPSSLTLGTGPSLREQERSSLVKKWAAWLAGKDVERGLRLLTSSHPSRHRHPTGAAGRGRDKTADREKADELVILSELRNTNTLAARRYLEWLVIGRGLGRGGKETPREGELFEEFVWNCVDEVLEQVGNEAVGRLWRAKAASYASSPSTATSPSPPVPSVKSESSFLPIHALSPLPRSPFLSYFALTTPESPSKRARIKTVLLLQSLREGTKLVKDVQDKITGGGWDKILGLEMAVLHSKIPFARLTLETLYVLRDTSTAESYASSGGLTGVVGTKVGVSAAEGCGLSDWSGWFAKGSHVVGAKDEEKGAENVDMLKMLLEVYMQDGDTQQAARLLSSQAKRLDVLDILPIVPTAWPLRALSTYLTRSLRRTQHVAHEGQIVRAICAGQNLSVLESTFEVLRDEGAIVEEAVSDDESGAKGDDGVGRSFDEKVVPHGGPGVEGPDVINVHVRGET